MFTLLSDSGTQATVIDDNISPSYGVLKPTKTIVITVPFENKIEITTKIEWKKK